MKAQFDETNRGALFKNERKETDKHPDYTGQLNVDGQDFWISAWLKTSQSGKRFMSLSVKPKDLKASAPAKAAAGIVDDFVDDDIPFS